MSPEYASQSARLAQHVGVVRRFAPAAPPGSAAPRTELRVAHWNILHGVHFERVLAAFRSEPALAAPDLVSLNEVDLGMPRSQGRDVAFDLAAALGMHAAWTALFLELEPDKDAAKWRPEAEDPGTGPAARPASVPAGESLFGLALLSQWPLGVVRRVELPSPEDLHFDIERRAGTYVGLVAEVLHPLERFHAVVTHLDVHGTPAGRREQMDALLAATPAGRTILAGDLNTTTFERGGWRRSAAGLLALAATPRAALHRRLLAPHTPAGAAREPLFDALGAAGFAVEPCNAVGESLDVSFTDVHELDALAGTRRRAVLAALRWVERRSPMRLDWIAARGFDATPGQPPFVLPHLMRGAAPASDHAPIGCSLRCAPPAT